jgi:hypothetical protein
LPLFLYPILGGYVSLLPMTARWSNRCANKGFQPLYSLPYGLGPAWMGGPQATFDVDLQGILAMNFFLLCFWLS